ncbi:MAG: signal peptidase I [Oscillospiraceae bacterium]|nr:signal peptidase I [Oscillospiraceae bacterium]
MTDKTQSAVHIQKMLGELDRLRLTHRRILSEMRGTASDTVLIDESEADAFAAELDAILTDVPEPRDIRNPFKPLTLEELTAEFALETEIKPAKSEPVFTVPVERVSPEKSEPAPDTPKTAGRARRIWNSPWIGAAVYGLMALIVIAVLLFKNSGDAGAPRDFFGFSGFTVLTRSMQSEIPQGSFVLVRRVDPNDLQIGDDITYMKSGDVTYTHRVTAVYEDYYDGKRGFQTKGVDNGAPDAETVIADNVVGRVVFHHRSIGWFLSFVRQNLLICALLGAMVLGLFVALRMIFSSKRAERRAEQYMTKQATEGAGIP